MKTVFAAAIASLALGGVAYAATTNSIPDISTLNPAALKAMIPSKIEWKPVASIPGALTAVLVGDPNKPGFYVVLNKFHAGEFSTPHYHPNERYILVVSGRWWVGTGPKFDPEHATVPMSPGTFVTHVGRQVHYDGVRTGEPDAVVMIFGQGPGTRLDCDGPKGETGPGPCADAKAAAEKP